MKRLNDDKMAQAHEAFGTDHERLKAELLSQLPDQPNDAQPAIRLGRRSFMQPRFLTSAAAAIVLAVLAGIAVFTPEGSVAWADVVAAMRQVKHLHVTILTKDDGKPFRADLYHRRPSMWRVHAKDVVQFVNGDAERVFDIRTRKFVEDRTTLRGRVINTRQLRRFGDGEGDMLRNVLAGFFRGKAPEGEPVPATPEALTPDMLVFDYARDATRMWVRIWVLRESRLPIRAEIYLPRSEKRDLVLFDYSDPQPEKFFDSRAFEQEVKEKGLRKPEVIYRVGAQSLNGKPTTRGDVHKLTGGYKAPRIQQITANDLGGLMLAYSKIERNQPASGSQIVGEGCAALTDNWGNVYFCTADVRGNGCRRSYHAPVPPYKHGAGKRVVTAKYVVHVQTRTPRGPHSHRQDKLVIRKETLEIPEPTVQGRPGAWAEHCPPVEQTGTYRKYMRNAALPMEQLAIVNRLLVSEPRKLSAVNWKMRLLKQHGRKEEAYKLFEERLLNEAMAKPFVSGGRNTMLTNYLFHLWGTGETAKVTSFVNRLEAAAESIRKSTPTPANRRLKRSIEGQKSFLFAIMAVPKAAAEFEHCRKPQVKEMALTRDGMLCVLLNAPGDKDLGGYGSRRKWAARPDAEEAERSGWVSRRHPATMKDGSLLMLFHGRGESIELVFEMNLVPREHSHAAPWPRPRLRWTMKVDVPAASSETLADMKLRQRSREQLHERTWEWFWSTTPSTPVERGEREARKLKKAKNFLAAESIYRKLLKMPVTDWPEDAQNDKNKLTRRRAWSHRLGLARCLLERDRFDEASQVIDLAESELKALPRGNVPPNIIRGDGPVAAWRVRVEMTGRLITLGRIKDAESLLTNLESMLPEKKDVLSRSLRTSVRWSWAALAEHHLENGRLAEAEAVLDRVESKRVNTRKQNTLEKMVTNPGGGKVNWTGGTSQSGWQRVDTVRWKLLEAKERLQKR